MKRSALNDVDECEEPEEPPNEAFNLRVFNGVELSFERHPILISAALRLFMDNIDTGRTTTLSLKLSTPLMLLPKVFGRLVADKGLIISFLLTVRVWLTM